MAKRKYLSPILMSSSGGSGNVSGDGSGQGSHGPEGMSFDEWWEEIAWAGENPDADYDGDGDVDRDDYQYYIENKLWEG